MIMFHLVRGADTGDAWCFHEHISSVVQLAEVFYRLYNIISNIDCKTLALGDAFAVVEKLK